MYTPIYFTYIFDPKRYNHPVDLGIVPVQAMPHSPDLHQIQFSVQLERHFLREVLLLFNGYNQRILRPTDRILEDFLKIYFVISIITIRYVIKWQ